MGKVKGLPPGGQLGVWGSPGCASPGILGEKGVSRPGGWKAPTPKSLLFRGAPSWGGGGMPPRISAAELGRGAGVASRAETQRSAERHPPPPATCFVHL